MQLPCSLGWEILALFAFEYSRYENENWKEPLNVLLSPQCLQYVSTNMVSGDKDIRSVCCVGLLRLRRDCGCEGIHCWLCAPQGMWHSQNTQRRFKDLL